MNEGSGLKAILEEIKGENDTFYDGYLNGVLNCYDIYMANSALRSEYPNALALLVIAISKQFSNEFLESIKDRPSKSMTPISSKLPNITMCNICSLYLATHAYKVLDSDLNLCKFCHANAKMLFG